MKSDSSDERKGKGEKHGFFFLLCPIHFILKGAIDYFFLAFGAILYILSNNY
jgi:hypothetical protein